MQTINRETALGLLNYASSYLAAAEYLHEGIATRRCETKFDAPLELLTGHGVEILLKSYLRSRGSNDDVLKKYGHDLVRLLEACENAKLVTRPTQNEREHLELLNEVFGKKPHHVRYLITGYRLAHDDAVILRWGKRVEQEIRPEIESTYSFYLMPKSP